MSVGKRFIDADKFLDEFSRSDVNRVLMAGWLERQPRVPKLIGRKRAAEILGVGSPYVSELIKAGEMPDPVKIDGGHTVYVEAEVKALAAKRKKARA